MAATSDNAIDPLDYGHALVAPFQGFPTAGLLTTPVWKYIRLAPRSGASVALGFSNGDPAIAQMNVGQGTCFLVATAASLDSVDRDVDPPRPWTALPIWPSFPPLMQEMVRLAVAGRAADRNITVGEELHGSVSAATAQTAVTLSGPGGFVERLPIRVAGGEARWTSSPLPMSGVYEAHIGSSVQRFAVNLNCAESDLTRIDPALLPSQLQLHSDAAADDSPTPAGGASGSYFRWFLAAVLLLLIVEPCLAWQFGRDGR
jgi:hypothetical protein